MGLNPPTPTACEAAKLPQMPNAKCQFDLEACEGVYVNAPCMIDGNLISGRTFHDNRHYVGPWITLLENAARAKLTPVS